MDGAGNIVVADSGNDRVQVFACGAAAGAGRQQGAGARSNGTGAGAGALGGRGADAARAGGAVEQAATVGSKRKRETVYASIFSPAAKAARTGSPRAAGGSAAAREANGRPAYDADKIREEVNILYKWEWRAEDGTYVPFDKDQCIEIETCYRQRLGLARVWGTHFPAGPGEQLKLVVDFDDQTAFVAASEWATTVRRWSRDQSIGDSWDHQVDEVSIVDVEKGWRDFTVVETALFGRPRRDGRVPTVSPATHELVKVRRIQNTRQLGLWEAERAGLVRKRGEKEVDLSCVYAWHGSGKTPPGHIAEGEGFMMQVERPLGPA